MFRRKQNHSPHRWILERHWYQKSYFYEKLPGRFALDTPSVRKVLREVGQAVNDVIKVRTWELTTGNKSRCNALLLNSAHLQWFPVTDTIKFQKSRPMNALFTRVELFQTLTEMIKLPVFFRLDWSVVKLFRLSVRFSSIWNDLETDGQWFIKIIFLGVYD